MRLSIMLMSRQIGGNTVDFLLQVTKLLSQDNSFELDSLQAHSQAVHPLFQSIFPVSQHLLSFDKKVDLVLHVLCENANDESHHGLIFLHPITLYFCIPHPRSNLILRRKNRLAQDRPVDT